MGRENSRREVVNRHDACRTGLLGELVGFSSTRQDILQTGVAQAAILFGFGAGGSGGAANCHAEALRLL